MLYFCFSVLAFFSLTSSFSVVSDRNLPKSWRESALRGGSVEGNNPRPAYSKNEHVEKTPSQQKYKIWTAATTVNVVIQSSNVTNKNVDPHILGVNYPGDGDYTTANYTIGRAGGNRQSTYNYTIDSSNAGSDWYFITNSPDQTTWQQTMQAVVNSGMDLLTQLPAMGWVAKECSKCWSFSQQKYGAQTGSECTGSGDATWCAEDAGDGIWVNNSDVVGNDPTDAMVQSTSGDTGTWAGLIAKDFPQNGLSFCIDNEPTLWCGTHRDVRPIGISFDDLIAYTTEYGSSIRSNCPNGNCNIYGYSPWGWCAYWSSGQDHQNGYCTEGPDRQSHNNMPMAAYYLQQMKAYEDSNNKKLIDYLDIHYYPQSSNVAFSTDESAQTAYTRLQCTRSLWDWSYIDDSWVNTQMAIIPRFMNWIDTYYPGTKMSISEYNFGADTIVTSALAHAEVVSIFATYGVSTGTRWVKPDAGSYVEDGYNLYLNYDGNGNKVFASDLSNIALGTKSDNVETVTSYATFNSNSNNLYVLLFNKATTNSTVNVNCGSYKVNSNGLDSYGFDKNTRLNHVGTITSVNGNSFSVTMTQWSVRLVILPQ